mmetsp:Transcript_19493/g.58476  ORF Transcript_19493/g.58476 Transcript_19493/m.58476 type:complete len:223 (+) Transcript_19493:160-828(+)
MNSRVTSTSSGVKDGMDGRPMAAGTALGPKASSPGIFILRLPPVLMPMTPSSMPGSIWPMPNLKSLAVPLVSSTVTSLSFRSAVALKLIATSWPTLGVAPVPTLMSSHSTPPVCKVSSSPSGLVPQALVTPLAPKLGAAPATAAAAGIHRITSLREATICLPSPWGATKPRPATQAAAAAARSRPERLCLLTTVWGAIAFLCGLGARGQEGGGVTLPMCAPT